MLMLSNDYKWKQSSNCNFILSIPFAMNMYLRKLVEIQVLTVKIGLFVRSQKFLATLASIIGLLGLVTTPLLVNHTYRSPTIVLRVID